MVLSSLLSTKRSVGREGKRCQLTGLVVPNQQHAIDARIFFIFRLNTFYVSFVEIFNMYILLFMVLLDDARISINLSNILINW